MPLIDLFEICSGSVTGKEHRRLWKNNQDALCLEILPECIVGIVCDGCGSQPQSEVGAQLGASLIARNIAATLLRLRPGRVAWLRTLEVARRQSLLQLRALLRGKIVASQKVEEMFLFSIFGFAIMPQFSAIFSLGDGIYALNGRVKQIGPFEDNAPPYLGYELFENPPFPLAQLRFQIQELILTSELQSLLVGSDGCQTFLENAEKQIPGKEEILGSLAQFYADDRYFNGYLPTNRLKLANRESIKGDWQNQKLLIEQGLLDDDTTLIALRRKKGGTDEGNP